MLCALRSAWYAPAAWNSRDASRRRAPPICAIERAARETLGQRAATDGMRRTIRSARYARRCARSAPRPAPAPASPGDEVVEQAEFAERARAPRAGPQIAVAADARDHAAAMVVPQHARTGRRLDERNAAASAAARLGAAEQSPVRRIEPVGIGTRGTRRPRRRTGSRRRASIGLARRSCLCQRSMDSRPSRSGRPRSLASPRWIDPRRPRRRRLRFCLLRTSALGDVTHVVPLVRTLQARWPRDPPDLDRRQARAQTRRRPAAASSSSSSTSARAVAAYRAVREQLAGRRFDALLHMQVALRANLLSAL